MVADLGCGVGYFTLKLGPKVGEHDSVLAEDILEESLTFFLNFGHAVRSARAPAVSGHAGRLFLVRSKSDPFCPAGPFMEAT